MNSYRLKGNVCELVVNSKTHGEIVFMIDSDDASRVKALDWHITKKRGEFRAISSVRGGAILLHRLITSFEWPIVDHANGDTLDNRKTNLRKATNSENGHNSRIRKNNKTGYKGVSQRKSGKFQAHIGLNSKRIFIGNFDSAIEAARAYNEAAKNLHGNFARLNTLPTAVEFSTKQRNDK